MVPKVAGKGTSFQGAALYYLHDKGALTSGRVAFVLTENLPTDDADKAIKCMAWTAVHQQEIKARAGGSAKGRRLEFPVYTYSLSWAPDESPDPEEMIAAARESLKTLGLERHETLFVSHNDEPHPHIHVIVNRVNPETGVAAKLSNDHLKLSAWAEAYEKRQGKIRCEQRVENNARRREKKFVKDRESQKAAEFHRWRRLRLQEAFRRREEDQKNLSAAHRIQRQFLFTQKEREVAKKGRAFREDNRTRWRVVYVEQQHERDKLLLVQRNAWSRLRHFLRVKAREYFHAEKAERSGFLSGAFAAISGGPRQFADLDKKHRQYRAKVSGAIDGRRRDAFNEVNTAYRVSLEKLKAQQRQQQEALDKRQSEESQRRAREIKAGLDKEAFRREQSAKLHKAIKETARDAAKPRSPLGKAFDRAKDEQLSAPPPARETTHERLKRKIAEKRRQEFEQTKQDITKGKPQPARDFRKVRGEAQSPPEPQSAAERLKKKTAARRYEEFNEQAKKVAPPKLTPRQRRQEAIKRKFQAFRELRDEITRDKSRERTIEPKSPKGPKNGH